MYQVMIVQEEEERFRPGTNKAVSLQVLKDAGTQGMSLGDIMEVSQARGLKEWEPGAKRILQFVSVLPLLIHCAHRESDLPKFRLLVCLGVLLYPHCAGCNVSKCKNITLHQKTFQHHS